jgi:exosortase J
MLLMLSQPVPVLTLGLVDGPLQRVAAEVARSFATMIGFAPSTPELRLMFSPRFGMFIAPGCDGIRGAVTMGYIALILGYVKRVSIARWAFYVSGAMLLGYIFNFLRLCVLVIYYRISIGHRALERLGTEADYVIGFCLFSIATVLVIWAAQRKNSKPAIVDSASKPIERRLTTLGWRAAALSVLVVLTISAEAREMIRLGQNSRSPQAFTDRFPKQIGAYQLTATKYEKSAGQRMVAAGIYSAPGSDPVTFGVWIAPTSAMHDANACWLLRGLKPSTQATVPFPTAHRTSANFDVGFYTEADSDTVVANTSCTAQGCSEFKGLGTGNHSGLLLLKPELTGLVSGEASRPVSFMIRIDRAHSADSKAAVYEHLSAEAKQFAEDLDLPGLTGVFQ